MARSRAAAGVRAGPGASAARAPYRGRPTDHRDVAAAWAALGSRPLFDVQLAGLADALEVLHTRVPAQQVDRLPPRISSAKAEVDWLREHLGAATPPRDGAVDTALAAGADWIDSDEASRFADATVPQTFALADGNLANVLWDGDGCAFVDFEDSGASDRAYEIADLVEHVRSWLTGALDADALLGRLDLDAKTRRRVCQARRVFALHWLVMLLPGNPGHDRNPAGSVDRQARRLLELLE